MKCPFPKFASCAVARGGEIFTRRGRAGFGPGATMSRPAAPLPRFERRPEEPLLAKHVWPAFGKPRTPGDILFWPRQDKIVRFTHWAVYVGRRALAPDGERWMTDACERTGEPLPEAVVHLWGAPDSASRDMSTDAVVVHTPLAEVGGTPYDGSLEYDAEHTPRRPDQILDRVLHALAHKLYENRFGGYHVGANNCEHFCTWARYGLNRSAQIGNALQYGISGLAALSLGAVAGVPAGMFAYSEVGKLMKENYARRRREVHEKESHFFPAEDDDEEIDWVVDCLVTHVEDDELKLESEKAARANGTEHRPRGAVVIEDDEGGEEERENAGRGGKNRSGVELFSVDSDGNLGGHVGNFLTSVLKGVKGEHRSGADEGADGDARGETRGGGEGSTAGRDPAPGGASAAAGASGGAAPGRPPASDLSKREKRERDVRDAVSGVGHLVGGLLGGMLKVGTAVASEIAKDQAKRAELRRADEAARVAGRPVLVELPDADADASA